MFALCIRWVLGVVRPRGDEAQHTSQWDESLQTDSAEGLPSFFIESELGWEVESAGN